jgi:hypothetical protein
MTLNKFKLHSILLLLVLSIWTAVAKAEKQTKPLPIFDGHIHYSHDVWDAISPQDAIRRLREVGVKRAMVSSSSDEGTQRLYQADPAFVVPSLRPYRKRGTIETWMYDETVIPYLKERLEKYRYAAIGELHIDGEQTYLPVMREIIRLAKKYQLVLHVHSDAHAIRFIFEQYPEATILWAHAGFDYAVIVGKLMDKHPNLMADLSFRGEIINDGHIMKAWNILLNRHADRFLLGIDTYEPQRWLQIKNVMEWQRDLLSLLPDDVAKKIAYDNSKRITKLFDDSNK